MSNYIYRLTVLAIGFLLTIVGIEGDNPALSGFGSFVLWMSILVTLINLLKGPIQVLSKNIRISTVGVFTSYVVIHFLVYSIAIEKLLTEIYGQLFSISSPFLTISITPFSGDVALSLVYNLIFNPSVVMGFPPNFYIELSMYAIVMGIVIAILVTATIVKVMELFGRFRKMRTILLAPLLGVIGGGSCCISIPLILSSAIPAANIILVSPVGGTSLLIAYVALPPLTALGLGYHFRVLTPRPPRSMRLRDLDPRRT
ncbi:hypothetical protein L3N51_02390 [Metallosphaera sp. J1]|uniref:hypothetical protein n=1 Tax=Metallosphaera javensis (ex Hofmann et al. 2022) TaxID=99938 RepID=UPI001EDFA4AD|nr:hypothetical protein [Metallosphaera javensis (ex Hofmann et al. 2022)]MCG3110093.1 hypothetical protein [Metallosphaera javensis (ex Hofmann et al. 2022)]